MSSPRNHHTARTLGFCPARPKLKTKLKKNCIAKQHWSESSAALYDKCSVSSARNKPEQMGGFGGIRRKKGKPGEGEKELQF